MGIGKFYGGLVMMELFDYGPEELLGTVESVDTATIIIRVDDDEKLKSLQVNHLIVVQSPKTGQHLIALVSKVIRKYAEIELEETIPGWNSQSYNIIKAVLIGTHYDKDGLKENVFRRSLSTVPSINAECYLINGERLKIFMQSISSTSAEIGDATLSIGKYSIDENAPALLNGNKFFQRHAVIVGSTGSGKSWCVAKILEQVASLKSANALLFDVHGEYSTLIGDGFHHLKIAGPNEQDGADIVYLPYWLLTYEEMLSLMLDRSDNNAPNQAMLFSSQVLKGKQKSLNDIDKSELASNITVDSPVPYDLEDLIDGLKEIDMEMIQSSSGREKQGPYYGKLTRFIQRLEAKRSDKRLNFMFNSCEQVMEYKYMNNLCRQLIEPAIQGENGVKIIDFSEVPSDILPLIASLIARIIFAVQQWTEKDSRTPIAIFCDEAHLYIPANITGSVDIASVSSFERISKEGRKYGVGLVVISQRPSEVNKTVLSQSNNFIAMRLTNFDDQSVVRRLLPDSLGDYSELLPILDIGEALIVGDASLLPSRIKITEPLLKPRSATIDFWTEWEKEKNDSNIEKAVESLRKQAKE